MTELTKQELTQIQGGESYWIKVSRTIGAGCAYITDWFEWSGNTCAYNMGMAKC